MSEFSLRALSNLYLALCVHHTKVMVGKQIFLIKLTRVIRHQRKQLRNGLFVTVMVQQGSFL